MVRLELELAGEVFEWRGPAPHQFVRVPEKDAEQISAIAPVVTYGWGCIPAQVTLGDSVWETSLIPKDGGYLVPLKVAYRRAEDIDLGDVVRLHLLIEGGH